MAYELFFDGFDVYSNAAEMLTCGYTGRAYSINSGVGRRGGKAAQLDSYYTNSIVRPITASSHVVVGGAIKLKGGGTIQLRNGTTVHASLVLTVLGSSTLAIGGGAAVTLPSIYPYDTYMFVELGVSVNNSTGTAEVRVNGSNTGWFPQVVGDTQNGATTTIDNIRVLSNTGGVIDLLDDFYITYGDELVWLGDSRADRSLLTANTATQDWIPSSGNAWERLNAGDGYIASDVDEATSFFELADLSYNPLAIHGVKITGLIKKSDAGYREACLLTNSDGTITETSPLALSTDTLGIVTILKTDPATGLAWDLPGVQALQPGLRVKV